jgi:hypothetical protein
MIVDKTQRIVSRALLVLMLAMLIYVTIGLSFHVAWQHALEECRNARLARGEFVEPEVFSGVLALFFNVTNWPLYAWANWYHWGTVLATPCHHSPPSFR